MSQYKGEPMEKIYLFGHELDPNIYHLKQKLRNVTVEILESDSGEISIGWYRQEDTEEVE